MINPTTEELLKKHPNLKRASDLELTSYIPTPFPPLNQLSDGGIPRGHWLVLAGAKGTSKTTSMLQTIAHNQSLDPDFVALFIDVERGFDKVWAEKLGVDLDRLLMLVPETNEQDIMEWFMNSLTEICSDNFIDMAVLDSIGALLPFAEYKKGIDEDTMLDLQKKLGLYFRKNVGRIYRNKIAVVLIGQVYEVPNTKSVQILEVKGGNALKHFSHVTWMTRRGTKDDMPKPINVMCPDGVNRKVYPGWGWRVRMDKSKVNERESQEVILPFYYGRGIDSLQASVRSAIPFGLATRSGAWITSDFILDADGNPGGKVQGMEQFENYFKENPQQLERFLEALNKDSTEEILETSGIEEKE